MSVLIINKMYLHGEEGELNKFFEFFTDENGKFNFDFEKVAKCPKELKNGIPYNLELAFRRYVKLDASRSEEEILKNLPNGMNIDEARELFTELYRTYGSASEASWKLENWSCNCNAEGVKVVNDDQRVVFFKTIWTMPEELIKTLSSMFPYISFRVECASNGRYTVSGYYEIVNGEICDEDYYDDGDFDDSLWREYNALP